jgi:hypothetical protein
LVNISNSRKWVCQGDASRNGFNLNFNRRICILFVVDGDELISSALGNNNNIVDIFGDRNIDYGVARGAGIACVNG